MNSIYFDYTRLLPKREQSVDGRGLLYGRPDRPDWGKVAKIGIGISSVLMNFVMITTLLQIVEHYTGHIQQVVLVAISQWYMNFSSWH